MLDFQQVTYEQIIPTALKMKLHCHVSVLQGTKADFDRGMVSCCPPRHPYNLITTEAPKKKNISSTGLGFLEGSRIPFISGWPSHRKPVNMTTVSSQSLVEATQWLRIATQQAA